MRPVIIAVIALAFSAVAAFVVWEIVSGLGARPREEPEPASESVYTREPEPEASQEVSGLAALTGIVEIGAPRDVAASACITDTSKASGDADSDYLLTAAHPGDFRRTSVRYSDGYTVRARVKGEWFDLGVYANTTYYLGVAGNTMHHLVFLSGCKDDRLNWLCPTASLYGKAAEAFRFPKDHPNVVVEPTRAFDRGRYAIWIPVEEALLAGGAIRIYRDFVGRIILRGKSRATRKAYVYDLRQGRFKAEIGAPESANRKNN